MARDKDKDRKRKPPKGSGKAASAGHDAAGGHAAGGHAAGGGHPAAKAHGRAATIDVGLPGTRAELMVLHAAARKRRAAAALGGEDFRAAVDEIARIEIRIAALDRAADPPLG